MRRKSSSNEDENSDLGEDYEPEISEHKGSVKMAFSPQKSPNFPSL